MNQQIYQYQASLVPWSSGRYPTSRILHLTSHIVPTLPTNLANLTSKNKEQIDLIDAAVALNYTHYPIVTTSSKVSTYLGR